MKNILVKSRFTGKTWLEPEKNVANMIKKGYVSIVEVEIPKAVKTVKKKKEVQEDEPTEE